MRLLRYRLDGAFPAEELTRVVFDSLRARHLSRVAIMGDDALLEALPHLGSEFLDPEKDYRWSGILVARKIVKPARRVIVSDYSEWFRWYMRTQRFRAFHTIVLLDPLTAVSDGQIGGYIDGLLARLTGKVSEVVVVAKRGGVGGPLPSVSPTKHMSIRSCELFSTVPGYPGQSCSKRQVEPSSQSPKRCC